MTLYLFLIKNHCTQQEKSDFKKSGFGYVNKTIEKQLFSSILNVARAQVRKRASDATSDIEGPPVAEYPSSFVHLGAADSPEAVARDTFDKLDDFIANNKIATLLNFAESPVEQQKSFIINVSNLLKLNKVNNSALTPLQKMFLQTLSQDLLILILTNSEKPTSLNVFDYPPGTVLEVSLSLKDLTTQIVDSKTIVSSVNSGLVEIGTIKKSSLNNQDTIINVLLIVYKNTQTYSLPEAVSMLGKKLWDQNFAKMYLPSVICESVKVRAIHPTAQLTGGFSINLNSSGLLLENEYKASNKSFVFVLYSPVLTANKNNYSLRLPLAGIHTKQRSFNSCSVMSAARGIAAEFKNGIMVERDSLEFCIGARTASEKSSITFGPVTDIYINGYVGKQKTSNLGFGPFTSVFESTQTSLTDSLQTSLEARSNDVVSPLAQQAFKSTFTSQDVDKEESSGTPL